METEKLLKRLLKQYEYKMYAIGENRIFRAIYCYEMIYLATAKNPVPLGSYVNIVGDSKIEWFFKTHTALKSEEKINAFIEKILDKK